MITLNDWTRRFYNPHWWLAAVALAAQPIGVALDMPWWGHLCWWVLFVAQVFRYYDTRDVYPRGR